ncbi:hypothetical protein GGH91_004338, partial [Coemansia sp. RSA 2671]
MPSLPQIRVHANFGDLSPSSHDALVVVYSEFADFCSLQSAGISQAIEAVQPFAKVDKEFGKAVVLVPTAAVGGGRLILSPMGSLADDTDDVRKIADAVKAGVLRAAEAGARRPAICVAQGLPSADEVADADYSRWVEVALLAALDAS